MTKITRINRRGAFLRALGLVSLIALPFLLSACVAAPGYEGPPARNFDGERFFNRVDASMSRGDFARIFWGQLTQREAWPDAVPVDPQPRPAERVYDGIVATYVNHATVLIQTAGLNILTDPVWAERVGPWGWAGPARVRQPGVSMADLPEIDVILVSHNHYDHLDVQALQALFERQETAPLLLAGLGNGALFEQEGLENFTDLQWGDSVTHGEVRFTFVECRHSSGRGVSDQKKTLWGSFVVESAAGNIYFAGDTAYGPHFAEQGERWGPFALTVLPIGAYEPRWIMARVHMNPEEAVRAHQDLGSGQSLGIHFGVFQLTFEGIDAPAADLAAALDEAGVSHQRFWVLEPGEARAISRAPARQAD